LELGRNGGYPNGNGSINNSGMREFTINKIKVLLVEDDPKWKEILLRFLDQESDIVIVGTVGTKDEAVSLVRMLDIDVVLIDVMLNGNGTNSIAAALEIGSLKSSKMIMVAFTDQRQFILEAFANGVTNYIVKANIKETPAAIREAYLEQSTLHFVAAGILRQEFIRMKRVELRTSLTAAESSILRFIHNGKTQSEIMNSLHITESTVKKHVGKIIKKMHVRTSKEAAKQANMKGII